MGRRILTDVEELRTGTGEREGETEKKSLVAFQCLA